MDEVNKEQITDARNIVSRLMDNLKTFVVGKDAMMELGLITLLSNGHLLIEGVPGLGKTTLAKTIAFSTSQALVYITKKLANLTFIQGR